MRLVLLMVIPSADVVGDDYNRLIRDKRQRRTSRQKAYQAVR
jgi:hypothetical protein